MKQATISTIKELKDFDWGFNPKIPKTRLVELACGRFVAQHADVLLIGPPPQRLRPLPGLRRG